MRERRQEQPQQQSPRAAAASETERSPRGQGWLNRNVVAMASTSFFSDLGHETATAILPGFLASIGAPPAALGVIEGVSDGVASLARLGAGWFGDRFGRRKELALFGYFLTGVLKSTFALATSWVHVLPGRVIGWFGRGIRGPLRDAMLVESVPPAAVGRAFGLEQTGDTLGAILGPFLAFILLGAGVTYRTVFALTLVPGLLAVFVFGLFVRDPERRRAEAKQFLSSFRKLPPRFRWFLVGVAVFGVGDFSHTLLILRAADVLTPGHGATRAAELAVLLFLAHNVVYALAALPIGTLSDRIGRRHLLVGAYAVGGLMALGFLFHTASLAVLASLFGLGGLYVAAQNTLERTVAADLLPAEARATGYGVLAAVNSVGDVISSIIVGVLWSTVGARAGFAYAAVLGFMGTAAILFTLQETRRVGGPLPEGMEKG